MTISKIRHVCGQLTRPKIRVVSVVQLWPKFPLGWAACVAVTGFFGISVAFGGPDDTETPAREQAAEGIGFNQFQMNEETLDANLFQPVGNELGARKQLESKLKLQLDELNRVCGLNESQVSKLKMAAKSDVKRFFDEVTVIRKKVKAGVKGQNDWNQIWQEIHPLRTRFSAGLFGESSFYAKSVRRTLTDEQIAKYDSVIGERRKFRYRAAIEVMLANFGNQAPLRRQQHDAIVKLMLEETVPPLVFGQMDQTVVMYMLGKIPEEKLKSLVDDQQWQQLQPQINQGRNMEQWLIQNGALANPDGEMKVLKGRVRRRLAEADLPANALEPDNKANDREKP